ncbi:MAG: SUMF1/EgtB/PvdO family nonheme iron enzyme [Kiritimatiellae bacterium]|nr:SUMF1/EgtB/PvdO family nonheme iron enzyme [Kiritimatiellia bacterium]
MDYDDNSLNSMPTAAGGARPSRIDIDEPSLGSALTMVGQGVPGAALGQIDQYQLVRKLGGGGFGVVYLARDTVSGVDVALKTLHPLLKSNPEEMEALRAKFALVSRLTHQNIAKALVLHPVRDITIANDEVRRELHLSPGDFVMVMDYAPGVTLSKWRRQFPDGIVPLEQALEVVRQVASALDYAHGEKIVHRDIKPANIMVETFGDVESHTEAQRHREDGAKLRVQILDFGLAAEIRSSMSRISTETGDTSGTRPYMAPEQWLGRKQDGRTDQYALACVAYELLSGAPPFAGAFETGDPVIMMATVKGEAPEEVEDVPAHVNAALQTALAKNPKERFSSCAEFVEAISNADTQGTQRNSHTEAQRHRENISDTAKPEDSTSAISEADVLRRKLALTKAVKAIPAEDRTDKEFSKFVSKAEEELAVAEEACKFGRFAAATESLTVAEAALDDLKKAKQARKEAERKAREEQERKAREEAERKAREEAERKAREEAERKAKEETVRREAERKTKEEELRHAHDPRPGELKSVTIALGVSMNFRWCPATTSVAWKKITRGHDFFWMGSPDDEKERDEDERRHEVILTNGFWLGETPITQGVWEEVMGSNPSYFLDGKILGFGGTTSAQRPVERVSWDDCQEFLKTLNARSPQSGLRWALPTEAQWEYACRAGTTGAYGGTGHLNDMGWYGEFFINGKTHPVKQKQPNAWGLYDMHGNVWEWCADRYGTYPAGTVTNPVGPASGTSRVCRGGSWDGFACVCRSARRGRLDPGKYSEFFGFRVALIPV